MLYSTITEKITEISMEEILNQKVSFQYKANSMNISFEMTIRNVLNDIKIGKYIDQIRFLRNFISKGDIEGYNKHKKKLPAVTFCGTFEERRKKETLKCYNNLVVIDIDKLTDIELNRIISILNEDSFVLAFWISPSQKGIKGLVHLKYDIDITDSVDFYHKVAFKQLEKYFSGNYNVTLDNSGSDTTRLCFFSYDKNIVCKNKMVSFEIKTNEQVEIEDIARTKVATKKSEQSKRKYSTKKSLNDKNRLNNPKGRNNHFDRIKIQAIIKYLTNKDLSITNTYEDWYRVAIAIANTFTYDIGKKYFIKLSQIDKNKFNENECDNLLLYTYENRRVNEISFKTIEYLASQKGYK
jgi:hypothetical protein